MFKKIFTHFVILSGIFTSVTVHAQHQHNHKICGTADLFELAAHDSEVAKQLEAMNKMVYTEPLNKTQAGYSPTEYVIPVVVHVVHDATNLPSGGKINPEQVRSQFQAMFNDYRRVPGTPGYGSGIDTKIEFSLATIDENGDPTTGINYIQNDALSSHSQASEETTLKNISRWDPTMYLNVYLVKDITVSGAPSGGTVLGYATFPGGATNKDGLVIRADCWGSKANYAAGTYMQDLGRTGVHEAGHWLNLYHTFQSGCSIGDQVSDTPPTANANYTSVYVSKQNTCSEPNDKIDDTRNFMDYADDIYADKFTAGQLVRVKGALNSSSNQLRYNLWQNSNLQATGTGPYKKPAANFWSWNQKPVLGQPVEFTEYSMGIPNTFNWTFTNGTNVFTATGPNPTVTFNVSGNWDVKLKVTNLVDSDSITKSSFIVVTAAPVSVPITENFQGTFPPSAWSIVNEDQATTSGTKTFVKTPLTGGFGSSTSSMRMDCFSYKSIGQIDNFVSPVFTATAPILEFSYAYSPLFSVVSGSTDILITDSLAVYISTDGGNTWPNRVFYKGGLDLRTTPANSTASFFSPNGPTSTDWVKASLDLSAYSGSNLRIKFAVINGYGNQMYIDDILIDEKGNSILDANVSNIFVSPNPFQDFITLNVSLVEETNVSYSICDIQGKVILSNESNNYKAGENKFNINMSNFAQGMYLVKVNAGKSTNTFKIVKM